MSSTNRLSVINGVLANYGQDPVATETGLTGSAKIINTQLDRHLFLFQQSFYDWSFLITSTKLSSPDETSLSTQWRYTFTFPSDYLRIYEVHHERSFQIRGNQILTNAPKLEIDYIRLTNDYTHLPYHFQDAFILFVAFKLCVGITRQEKLKAQIQGELKESLAVAQTVEYRLKGGEATQLNQFPKTGMRRIRI